MHESPRAKADVVRLAHHASTVLVPDPDAVGYPVDEEPLAVPVQGWTFTVEDRDGVVYAQGAAPLERWRAIEVAARVVGVDVVSLASTLTATTRGVVATRKTGTAGVKAVRLVDETSTVTQHVDDVLANAPTVTATRSRS